MERVFHVNRDPYDVYVGRGRNSKWGNPFRIGDPHPQTGHPIRRGEAIELYKEYVVRGAGRHLLRDLGELDGKNLGCFCAPKGGIGAHDPLLCHGQILLLLVEHRRKKLAERRARTSGRPVHRFRDGHRATNLLYCPDCQTLHPTLLIHEGPAPAGAACQDCETSNPKDSLDEVPQRYIFFGSW